MYDNRGLVLTNIEDPTAEAVNVGPEYLLHLSHGIGLGKGDEDTTRDALDKLCDKMMQDHSIPTLPEGFNVIPDRDSFLLMDGTTEKMKITLPDLQIKGGKRTLVVHKLTLKEYASIKKQDIVADIHKILEWNLAELGHKLGIESPSQE